MICPQCGTENRPGARFCSKCGATLSSETVTWTPSPAAPFPLVSEPSSSAPAGLSPGVPVSVPQRFPVLRILSVVYKVLGGLVGALTILGILGACIISITGSAALGGLESEWGILGLGGGILGAVIASLILLLYGGFIAITLYGAGELLTLFISIEENTRAAAQK